VEEPDEGKKPLFAARRKVLNGNGAMIEHFEELEPEVREFLEELGPKDIKMLKAGMEMAHTVTTLQRVFRWLVIAMFALFLGIVSISDGVMKLRAWFPTKLGGGP